MIRRRRVPPGRFSAAERPVHRSLLQVEVQIYLNLPRKLAVFPQLAASANRVAANEKPVTPPAKQANLTCRRITAVKWNPEPPPCAGRDPGEPETPPTVWVGGWGLYSGAGGPGGPQTRTRRISRVRGDSGGAGRCATPQEPRARNAGQP